MEIGLSNGIVYHSDPVEGPMKVQGKTRVNPHLFQSYDQFVLLTTDSDGEMYAGRWRLLQGLSYEEESEIKPEDVLLPERYESLERCFGAKAATGRIERDAESAIYDLFVELWKDDFTAPGTLFLHTIDTKE